MIVSRDLIGVVDAASRRCVKNVQRPRDSEQMRLKPSLSTLYDQVRRSDAIGSHDPAHVLLSRATRQARRSVIRTELM